MPGDLEGNVEHNECAVHTGQFCRVFGSAGVAPTGRVCVLFPDAEERDTAAAGRDENVFSVTANLEAPFAAFKGRLDYLCEGGGVGGVLEATGVGRKLGLLDSAAERASGMGDEAFVIAYPSANIDEMLQVRTIIRLQCHML